METIDDFVVESAFNDLTVQGERLYVAAQRYVRAFERDEIDFDHVCDDQVLTVPQKVHIGRAGHLLEEASERYRRAYGYWEHLGGPEAEAA